ncbi:hypothetical protein [Actinomadura luteofluorescens]|uniref:hypothetical protein n=1 Tax=Actinomadura luteofluorescens TaxID=46163 RepID=UPI003D9225FC
MIDEIAREGTGRMPPEVDPDSAQFTDQRDEDGRRLAQARRRAVNALRLVAPVRAGARFERGRLVERPEGAAT